MNNEKKLTCELNNNNNNNNANKKQMNYFQLVRLRHDKQKNIN